MLGRTGKCGSRDEALRVLKQSVEVGLVIHEADEEQEGGAGFAHGGEDGEGMGDWGIEFAGAEERAEWIEGEGEEGNEEEEGLVYGEFWRLD